jgi:hypothetical protein
MWISFPAACGEDSLCSCVNQLVSWLKTVERMCGGLCEARVGYVRAIHAVLLPILLPQVRNSTSSVSVFMSLSEIEYIDLVHLALALYLITHGGSPC